MFNIYVIQIHNRWKKESVSLIRIFFKIALASRDQCPSLLGVAKHDVEALRKRPETQGSCE